MGVLCILGDRPLGNEENAKAIIKVFAARAAVELLRQRAETALHQAYDELEGRVQARTVELATTNSALASEVQERIAAETALRQQAEHEQLIAAITQHIRQSLNLREILTTTVVEVRRLLQTNRVVIYQFNPDWGGAVIVESVEPGWMSTLGMMIQDDCFAETYVPLYQQGRIKATNDIHSAGLALCHIELLTQLQVKANLVVPILQGETLWGLLIAHQCDVPRHWQSWEMNLLDQLATQLAIAIQQSELFEQIQQNNTNLEQQVQERTAQIQQALALEASLKRITDKVRDSLDESQILQTAVHELIQLLQVDYCDTALYDLEKGTSTIWYEQGPLSIMGQDRVVQMVDFPDIYPQLLQGHYLQFCQRASDSIFSVPPRRASILTCPMFDDQGVIGDLWLSHEENHGFNELEIRLVQQVANQCAIALRQARLYQATQAQVKELEKLNRLKDDFLSTVSHELRTPMSSIKMATHMLEIVLKQAGLLDVEPSTAARYFKILQDECQREIGLINDLLDLARLDAETEPLMPTTIDFQLWFPTMIEPFIERTLNQNQQLKVHFASDLPLLTTDVSYLSQVLTELLHNACKYTPHGEQIMVETTVTESNWQFSVSNSAVKISASECERIFDKFYRIPNNDPWKHGGTGLGLALVKKRVKRLGAKIRVECEAGQIRFTIKLPINPGASESSKISALVS
ncbi:MAG: ATPase [Leptolyngbya sp.]|nr:MAG: ATPase [Leptolyngbya sp.]